MSFYRPTRVELAVHEAGHAYAFAALVRHEPWELGLAALDDGTNHGWCRRKTLLLREVRLETVPPSVRPAIDWQAAAEIVIAIAGPIAEFRHRLRGRLRGALAIHANADPFLIPGSFDGDGDFQRIRDTLAYIGTPDRLATFERMIDVSEEIVAANWPAIGRLSRLLLKRGHLGEDDLIAWFEGCPAKRHEGHLKV